MIALFIQGKRFIGYKPNVTEEEAETFQLNYILVDEMPNELLTIPENHYAEIEQIDGELVVTYVELPPVPPTPEDKITQLEAENASVWYELMLKEMAIQQHEQDIADLWYEVMTGGM